MTLQKAGVGAVIALGMILLHASPASAQFTSGIEGTVIDGQGGLVPGATVTITNEETSVSQSAQTTEAGYYRFTALPRGLFTVRVSLSGFRTAVPSSTSSC